MQAGAEALGWNFVLHQPQHRPGALLVRDRRLPRLRRSVRVQALDGQDLPPGRATTAARRSSPAASPSGSSSRAAGPPACRRATSIRRPGATAAVTVRAPQVVVACGALESPALLLRSGIGGPAAGDYLRLHPCTAVFGYYPEDTQAWRGAPARRARARVRERRGRLRLPDRGRAVHDRGRRPRRCRGATARRTSG